jgi:hypothetical protein
MGAQNNLHVPEDLLSEAQRLAESQGRTADDLAVDALKRYLAHEWLDRIDRDGEEHRRSAGLKNDEDVESYVERVIADSRRDRRLA